MQSKIGGCPTVLGGGMSLWPKQHEHSLSLDDWPISVPDMIGSVMALLKFLMNLLL